MGHCPLVGLLGADFLVEEIVLLRRGIHLLLLQGILLLLLHPVGLRLEVGIWGVQEGGIPLVGGD